MKETKLNLDIESSLTAVKNVVINFIVPIVCFVLMLLMVLFVIIPSYKEAPTLKATIAEKTTTFEQLTAKLSNLNKLVDYKSVIEENSKLVDQVLVPELRVPQLLTQVDQMAKENGLSVVRLNYGYDGNTNVADSAPGAYKSISVSLGVEGTISQFLGFLRSTETAARWISVDNFRFSGANTDGATSGVEAKQSYTVNLTSPFLYVQSNAVTDDPIELDISSKPFLDLMNKLKELRFYNITVDSSSELVKKATESTETPTTPTQPVQPTQ
jgi:Tfp pilus assembly protein PilO